MFCIAEVPLFHVLTAKITFDNIFGGNTPVPSVTTIPASGDSPAACDISDSVFELPADYEISAEEDWWRDDLLAADIDGQAQADLLYQDTRDLALTDSETEEFIKSLEQQRHKSSP